MTDIYRLAGKHKTKIRKIERWYQGRIAAITKDRDEQLAAADAELTPEIRAVIAAVEAAKQNGSGQPDPSLNESYVSIPARLLETPPEMSPGSMVSVDDKPRRVR